MGSIVDRVYCCIEGVIALYAAIDPIYPKVLDSEIQIGLLLLDLDDEDAPLSYEQQKRIVEQILGLVAKKLR